MRLSTKFGKKNIKEEFKHEIYKKRTDSSIDIFKTCKGVTEMNIRDAAIQAHKESKKAPQKNAVLTIFK